MHTSTPSDNMRLVLIMVPIDCVSENESRAHDAVRKVIADVQRGSAMLRRIDRRLDSPRLYLLLNACCEAIAGSDGLRTGFIMKRRPHTPVARTQKRSKVPSGP